MLFFRNGIKDCQYFIEDLKSAKSYIVELINIIGLFNVMPPLYGADPLILTRINDGSDTNFCMNWNIHFYP